MLRRLKLENYTVMPSVEVRFGAGLNVVTGETGVGKSLLLDAVGFLLGERRTNFPIRSGSQRAVIEAEFDAQADQSIRRWLAQSDFSPELPVILRREFLPNNRTRLFINDTPATLQQSRAFGDLLLDLHGQHETVALFDRSRQLEFLDEFCRQPRILEAYRGLFAQVKSEKEKLAELRAEIEDSAAGRSVLEVQKREIAELKPRAGEIAALEIQLKRLENAEQIFNLCKEICDGLNEAPGSAVENISTALRKLPDLISFEANLENWIAELENARSVLLEANRVLLDFSRTTQHNPQYVEEVRERLVALLGLRKRWQLGEKDLCDVITEIDARLVQLEGLDGQAEAMEENIKGLEKDLVAAGRELSSVRQKAGRLLEKGVKKRLADIGMPKADFRVQFTAQDSVQPLPDGLDRIEFSLSPDGKIPHQPLRNVASGGEMSRIHLALKGTLAAADRVETLIFDEIDQGISGRVAHKVGLQLLELAKTHQVIVVTHLPQIASLGNEHLSVRSAGKDGSATVEILDDEGRVEEVASLLAASGVSEGALLNAREMLESARAARSVQ
ncbi:MAG TPA: DNA repair protein RecN [bacterium]|jgi:DNA repair protein RecN (Recombination protein N)